MTDKEIIQALECCSEENCNNCTQRNNKHDYVPDCKQSMLEVWLDLIERQQAEIERMNKENKILEYRSDVFLFNYKRMANEIAELTVEKKVVENNAIRQFAEKLITNIKEHYKRTAHGYNIAGWNYSVSDIEAFVHNLVKEMEERNERTSFGSSC